MRIVALISILASASAFGVTKSAITTRSTALNGVHGEPTEKTLANIVKADRWKEIRFLSDEEAVAQLTGEELESYQGYHAEAKEGLEKMKGIATMMLKSLNPPLIAPKGKKQRKRDKWEKTSKVLAARAAAELK